MVPALHATSAAATNWLRHEVALRAFETTAGALRARGVPVVPVKGILLSRWLYQDVTERPFLDVDLLVPRRSWHQARHALLSLGEGLYESTELGELTVDVQGVHVEIHAEIGRLEITDLTVDDLLERATSDAKTFGFPILRVDDVDHALFVVVNAVKDGLALTPAHVPEDLERLLARIDPAALVERAHAASFATGLTCAAEWMARSHGSQRWGQVLVLLGPPRRRMYARVLRAFSGSRRPSWHVAVALGCWSNDRFPRRAQALARLVRRNALKLAGRSPP